MSEPADFPTSTVIVTGSAEAPAFKRRPIFLLMALIAYAAFVALLIVWAVKLHHAH